MLLRLPYITINYLAMQFFMLCKCVFSRKKFHTKQALMSLFFMYTSNMSSKFTFKKKCLIAEITFRNHVWIKNGCGKK